MTLTEKLKEEARLREKAQEAKANLEKELAALYKYVETARADAIAEFKASQPFINACAVYYGDRFEDYLKQVRFVYLNLDLSKVTMDDFLLTTPADGNTVNEETDDSTQSKWLRLLMTLLQKTVRSFLPRTLRTLQYSFNFFFNFFVSYLIFRLC